MYSNILRQTVTWELFVLYNVILGIYNYFIDIFILGTRILEKNMTL